jgi:Rrf2 family iron-sulfur cluster assembly transcriptional regulator
MLRLSRKTLLALEAVIDIAYNARPDPVQAREITARQGVPQRYLEQVMQQLVRAGILKGVRGPRGGYRLARERRRISVGEVIRIATSFDTDGDELSGGSEMGRRVVMPIIASLQEEVMQKLDLITIEDLCTKARESGLEYGDSESQGPLADFTI